MCIQYKNRVKSSKLYDISGKTDLVQLCETFQTSKVLICNDSGAMHLANALGTSIIALFGPTDPSVTGSIFKSAQQEVINMKITDSDSAVLPIINKTCQIVAR